jgi:hypothetical protein
MKNIIEKIIVQVVLLGIAFWIVGWKIWVAVIIMMWANNIYFFKK